ncbi:rhomboid family intramembrane serine protease [Ornithinimicrobium ciconiae]|uniref:Rhomboid family intramembrane serine protease n=1 Tax=Ornithinimicrobium ciconiae TaxID=2594265 RepID=A0A516GDK2_9MICO|nr:rhomboid family intramembrane serine protease [Ornithinimicrobium ciconiae]QDO89593.1 rhomboid family intramembrane serine protease [Ornithinimicrobium ciconiae]
MSAVAVVAIWVAYLAGWTALRGALTALPTPPWWAILLWCVVAVPSLVQLLWAPGLLAWGQRDNAAVSEGQWRRLATSIVLQDGGWGGTVFNLVMLAVTLLLVAQVWRPGATVAVFVIGGVACNVLTVLLSGEPGAGNSMATMCLLSAAAVTVVRGSPPARRTLVPVILVAVAAVVLLVGADEHGPALALGLLVGLLVSPRIVRS